MRGLVGTRPFRMPLHSAADSALRFEDFRSAAGPDRYPYRCAAVKYKELRGEAATEDSAAVRERVVRARKRQLERFASEKRIYANAQMPPKLIRKHCAISAEGEKLLETAVTRLGLSARSTGF